MSLYSKTIKIQEKLAKRVTTKDTVSKIKNICAVDVSYKKDIAYCSAVVMDRKSLNQLESVNTKISVKHPYIPGLFMLRESEPILHTLKKLKTDFQLLLVDGHGQLHPRRCGLACFLGITLDVPTIGVAKSLLCGSIKGSVVKLDGKILGAVIQKKEKKKIFVSIGHKISLKSAVKIVDEMILDDQWLPEPLRVADVYSKNQKLFGTI